MPKPKFRLAMTAAAAAALMTGAGWAQDKPARLDLGVFTFLSGPSAAYGLPGKQGAELMIERINAQGGIGGVPVSATYVDEAQGAEGVIAEYRRLAEGGRAQAMIAALSSGNCLALSPLADQLKMPTIGWNCDTHQLFLKDQPDYFYRPNGNTIAEFMAYTLYFLQQHPEVKRVAIINPDYAFGHDAAEIVKATLKAVRPEVEIVAELYPKLGASTYQTEISRLSAARPDVVFSNLWGGDLENFVRQAGPRGLFRQSAVVLALGETVMQRVDLPEGTIVGVLGDGWWMSPDARTIGEAAPFAAAYREKYGSDPVFPTIKMANSLIVLKAAYEKAISDNDGAWPDREQVVAALEGLSVQTLTGTTTFRDDNDGVVDQVIGTVGRAEGVDRPVMTGMVRYDGEALLAPVGQDPIAWIGTLTPDFLADLPRPGSYN
ncbi:MULTISPECIES: ABC transporter substrate-binding protein [Paracoccus]|uniref:Amino acid/amide ABC transporter substrate-binding protein (HAAT family) n=1 Tax=Paracoccus versutus TaxID=34007 RepID=A0A3D9XRM8_PARVE|nr:MULTISPECIES: ABC transporter substrate-binding protein [Paracoccus]REF73055.1 amino acid/amide ABC transporter substrate-binding protein (HAAT family) [Paracoccus versutus]